MKNYNGNDIVCSLVIIMIITIVYNFIFKKKDIEGFEWMKETDNNAWKNELVKLPNVGSGKMPIPKASEYPILKKKTKDLSYLVMLKQMLVTVEILVIKWMVHGV